MLRRRLGTIVVAARRLAVFDAGVEKKKRCFLKLSLVVGDVGAVPRHEGDGVKV